MKSFILAAAVGVLALGAIAPANAEVVVKERGAAVVVHRHHADCRVVKVKKRLPNGNVIVKTRRSC
ncbi:MAG: hypothetical protein ACTHLO_05625 [Pseudolabrys sp.]